MRPLLLLVLLVLSASAQSAAVWKVTKDGNTFFLGGTLHVLSPSDYPLPQAYYDAYAKSDGVVFETDIGALNSPEFQQATLEMLAYHDGTTLEDVLSSQTLAKLAAYLQQRGLSIDNIRHFTPALVSVTLSMIEFQQIGLTSEGVDNYFYQHANADAKNIEWFETPLQQLSFIAKMGNEDEDAMINYALDDVQHLEDSLALLTSAWRQGDMDLLYEKHMESFALDYPTIYHDLLVQRNVNWLPHIEALAHTPSTEFILVGTMHLAGKDGLLAMLSKRGYDVAQLAPQSVN